MARADQPTLTAHVDREFAVRFRAWARKTDGGTATALRRLATAALNGSEAVHSDKHFAPKGTGRGEQIGFRLKADERRALDEAAKAHGTSPANWVRSLTLVHLARKPQWNPAEEGALRDLGREIASIGRNINQIARAMNVAQHSGVYPPHQGVAVREAAELIRSEMRRVVAVLSGDFDYWGLPEAERPTAAPGAVERHDAQAAIAKIQRRRRPRLRPSRFVDAKC